MESRVTVTLSLPSLAKTVKAVFSIRRNIKIWSWPVSSRHLYDRRACQLVYAYSPVEGNSWGGEINGRAGGGGGGGGGEKFIVYSKTAGESTIPSVFPTLFSG